MKVMAIGIYQPGGILYVFDITTFLKSDLAIECRKQSEIAVVLLFFSL